MTYPPYPPPPPSRPPRWGRVAAWTAGAAVAAFAVGGGLGIWMEDDSSSASPDACKVALADNYRQARANGPDGPTLDAPAACAGVDAVTLRKLTGDVITEYLDGPEADEDMRRAMESAMASAAGEP
jgi:hypothetical protein